MFTVKVIDHEGNESIMQARSVQARASELRLTSESPYAIQSVWFQTDEGAEVEIGGGATIYVMNDSGKTVSKYALGAVDNSAEVTQ